KTQLQKPHVQINLKKDTVINIEDKKKYKEYKYKTSTGPDTNGSKMINSMREGTARYNAWLVQQYKQNKMEEKTLTPMLENSDIPKELNFNGDPDLIEGARLYRRIMRSVYKIQGAGELRVYQQ